VLTSWGCYKERIKNKYKCKGFIPSIILQL
jgi:hypothetical protein